MIIIRFIIIFLLGALRFVIKRKHLLIILLRLEFVVLSLFFGLILYFKYFLYENYFRLIFICFAVSEGALGLSLLVLIIRTYGNDYFQRFNILW